jgi:hypothetical protein
MLNQVFIYLNNEVDSIAVRREFGYKERIQIERGLFLIVKLLCSKIIKFNLQGFSKAHKDDVLKMIPLTDSGKNFSQLVDRIFQFKVFILSLSSENAYVRGDALSRMGLKRQNVLSFIKAEIGRIRDKVADLNVEDA